MKLIIFTFLAICLLCFSLFAQTEKANKIGEVGDTSDGDIKNTVQNVRDSELAKNAKSKLYVINYGMMPFIAKRMKQLNRAFDFTPVDRTRLEIVSSVFAPYSSTEFWIVPEGAENPKPTIYAEKVNEFGNAYSGDLKFGLFSLTEKLDSNVLYICNFGTKIEKLKRVKVISKLIKFLSFEKYGIQIIDGGTSKPLKTEFWLVPKK